MTGFSKLIHNPEHPVSLGLHFFSEVLMHFAKLTVLLLFTALLIGLAYMIANSISEEPNPSKEDIKSDLIHEHWMIYGTTIASFLAFTTLLLSGYLVYSQIMFIIAVFSAIRAHKTYVTNDMILANHHIKTSEKVPKSLRLDIDIDNIERVEVQQSTLGRVLGYGTLLIYEKNQKTDIFPCIEHPHESEDAINKELAA
tara:strand:+ start:1845 stop:2438 length:594 start_codon:yes stop_codon:yes gene_type:complete